MNSRCIDNDVDYDYMNMNQGCSCPMGNPCPPIYECPMTRVCERVIMHDVPHVMPITTKIINRHVYRHTYTPVFSCEECDTCENIYDSCPKNF